MIDLSIFTTAEAWISLVTLLFLEIVLGVDNIVFISITTNRLPEEKQHIGRKLGLAGAMLMRIAFLSVASYFVHMTQPLFTIDVGFWSHSFSVRDLVLLAGGAYLLYKGISELVGTVTLADLREEEQTGQVGGKRIGLGQAVGTIMVMDIVFSIDSVITAVGLADHLLIMILAVIIAVLIMMAFIDPISEFIDRNTEMKILAVMFISIIGVLLVLDSLGINSGIEVLDMHMEKLMVYFAMLFAVVLEFIQIRWKSNFEKWEKSHSSSQDAGRQKASVQNAASQDAAASEASFASASASAEVPPALQEADQVG